MNSKERILENIKTVGNWGGFVGDALSKVLSYLFRHQEQQEEDIDALYAEIERLKEDD